MEPIYIQTVLQKQKAFFSAGKTFPVSTRKTALKKLLDSLESYEAELTSALHADLGKSAAESYMCEIGLVKSEIRHMLRHLSEYARPCRVHTPIGQMPSRSYIKPVPYGTVLIMSPWNYPLLLSLDPLADALAAGNTAVLKPSAYAPATADILEKIIKKLYPPDYVTVIKGGRQENAALLDCNFDYIFFTGSKPVGKEVMCKASERLIPITLELEGKSPCIVDETSDIRLAARRIVFGKFINCGQTCVAPDYIYCADSIKDKLINELQIQIKKQYGTRPLENPAYGKIINKRHFDRLCGLMDSSKIICGGQTNAKTLQISPTVMAPVTWEDAVMGEEIFGPLLPVVTYKSLREAAAKINSMDAPLALYIFSSSKKAIRFATEQIRFGGGCVNDTLVHLATSNMGFGGVGASGMGSYHGKAGFDTFSHKKSIVDKKTFPDLPLRYRPHSKLDIRLIRLFER